MSRLLLMEVAMKNEYPDLYETYFGENALLYYNDKVPFIVAGLGPKISEDAIIELSLGCKEFKAYHKELFGIEVKSFVVDDKTFKKVKNWWRYFHPHGIYK